MTDSSIVYVVHCVDTEGPLSVPLETVFADLERLFGISLPPNRETLQRLQEGALPVAGLEEEVRRVVSPDRLAYLDSWSAIDEVLDELATPAFRSSVADSFGGGWVFNWFCVDHVGFETNPRNRCLGFHAVFDHYREFVSQSACNGDGIHFHHHPVPFSRAANHSATHYFNHTPIVFEILARRILERHWFPCAFRPGFHAERPDSHWFLEQFIPFDFANQRQDDSQSPQRDQGGRFGDWRRAPNTWRPYHPHHDDYQSEGGCRRWIARVLNLDSRHHQLTDRDVEQAFTEAEAGLPTILAFTDHDFRDIRPDVRRVHRMISAAASRHPAVRFKNCEARRAMQEVLGLSSTSGPELDITIEGSSVTISAKRPIFGPQPFLALGTRDGRCAHDNLDMQVPFRRWTYALDEQTLPVDSLRSFGVAAVDEIGRLSIAVREFL